MKSIDQDKAKLYQRKAISIENWKGGEAYRIIPSDTLKTTLSNIFKVGISTYLNLTLPLTKSEK